MKTYYIYFHLLIIILMIGSPDLSFGLDRINCTTNVTVIVTMSCPLVHPYNATVTLNRHNPGAPPPLYDTVYTRMTDTTGIVHFTNLCNGIYDLSVSAFGYDTSNQINIGITGDMTINLTMQQVMTSPPDLLLNNQTLLAQWGRPRLSIPILTETWESGNFTGNQWTTSGSAGGNWVVTNNGHPSPSAEFNGSPLQINYDGYLASKVLTGLHSPVMKLTFDIFLNNRDVGNVNTMAVEVWNGITWIVLKTYTNQGGNIIWSREHLDISSVANSTFRIRFHATGTSNISINNWNIDNIAIEATGLPGNDPCILGYNFYLNNILTDSIIDTSLSIQKYQVGYGVTYDACVTAVYNDGSSSPVCTTFTSQFLCPVTHLTALAITNAAYLTWTKPQCLAGQDMCFIYDDGTMENGLYWANANNWFGNKFIFTPTFTGAVKSFDLLWWNNPAANTQPFTIDVFSLAGVLMGTSQTFTVPNPAPTGFMTIVLANEIPFSGQFYGMVHFNMLGVTHYLGMDQNGPYVNSGVGYWYNGTLWQNASALGYGACLWTVRCCAFVYGEDKMVTLGPDFTGDVAAPVTNPSGPIAGPVALNPSTSFDSHNYSTTPPDAPMAGTGLIGYNVYQNGAFHHYVPGADSLRSYCFNLDPGLHCFDVNAKYDMSVYGFPGTFGESLPETPGPACVYLIYCCPFPLYEPWNGGSLGYQDWTNGSNWQYTPAIGNPAPSAKFTSQPVLTNYNSSLKSMTIDATVWTCASMWLDFDYRLDDQDATGTEKMNIEVFWNHAWHPESELVNNGSVSWTSKHIDISGADGQQLSVRFRANGASTQHILNWYFDNIRIYAVCHNPVDFKASQTRDTINLTWSAPQCGPFGQSMCFIFDDGTPESGWAISPGMTGWLGNLFTVGDSVSGNLHSFNLFWKSNSVAMNQDFRIDVFTQAGVLLGSSETFRVPIVPPAAFMTVTLAHDIPFTGSFYGMVRWNNFAGPSNFLGFDLDGPSASQDLAFYYDGSVFKHMSAVSGNGIHGVFTLRTCAFLFGKDVYPYSNNLAGYNLYRYDSIPGGLVHFHKLNTMLIPATTYKDTIESDSLQHGFYRYFVTALFNSPLTGMEFCESPGSDTITVRFPPSGVEEISDASMLLFPNPGNEFVSVKSDFKISRIEILNFLGQTVFVGNNVNTKLTRINTSSLPAGVYLIKVKTSEGSHTAKITIVH